MPFIFSVESKKLLQLAGIFHSRFVNVRFQQSAWLRAGKCSWKGVSCGYSSICTLVNLKLQVINGGHVAYSVFRSEQEW